MLWWIGFFVALILGFFIWLGAKAGESSEGGGGGGGGVALFGCGVLVGIGIVVFLVLKLMGKV